MAKVTIVIEDTEEGASMHVEFDPPFGSPEEATQAQMVTAIMLDAAKDASKTFNMRVEE